MMSSGDGWEHQERWNSFGEMRRQEIEVNPEKFQVIDSPIASRAFIPDLMRVLGDLQGKRVLELGCGLGHFAVFLAKQGAEVTAVDIGQDLVDASAALVAANRVKVTFRQCNIVSLPFDSSVFDFVVGLGVLHHLRESQVPIAIGEASRVLTEGGLAVFHESVENSRIFNFLQNLIPVGSPDSPSFRPSMLQRRAWKHYQSSLDERDMTTNELREVGSHYFRSVKTLPVGLFIRLGRLVGSAPRGMLIDLDKKALQLFPFLSRYSQSVLVEYRK